MDSPSLAAQDLQIIQPPTQLDAHPLLWLAFYIFHLIDLVTRQIGRHMKNFFSMVETLATLAVLTTIGAIFCSLDTVKQSWYMIISIIVLVLGDIMVIPLISRGNHDRWLVFRNGARLYFGNLLFLLKAGGTVLFLGVFITLTEQIEKHQGIDVYTVGFFFCVFVNFVSIAKLVGSDDILGIADSTMALSVFLYYKLPQAISAKYRAGMWALGSMFEVFKLSDTGPRPRIAPLEPLAMLQQQRVTVIEEDSSVCRFWKRGYCTDRCTNIHAWSTHPRFVREADIIGHTLDIKGLAILPGSRLYSANRSGKLLCFNTVSYELIGEENLQSEVGCIIAKGNWLLIGLRNGIQVCKNNVRIMLTKPDSGTNRIVVHAKPYNALSDVVNTRINEALGLVTAMIFTNGMLFVGTSRGRISFWKDEDGWYTYNPQPFRYLGTFIASHTEEITCLASVGGNLFSGSADNIIRVWDLNTFECDMIITAHNDTVTSLLSWGGNLFSSSLDGTVKVWNCSEHGQWVQVSNHIEGHSVHGVCAMIEGGATVICCSNQTGTVNIYIYHDGRFIRTGSLYALAAVDVLLPGPKDVIFSGGKNGTFRAWRKVVD